MLSISLIKHFAALHAGTIYIIIALGALIEGEIVVIIAGIFAHLGAINVFIAFLAALVGCGLKSLIGYSFGNYLHKYHSNKPIISKAERRINYFLPHFEEKPFMSLYLSRFLVLGIYWFALVYSGYKKIDLKTFIKAEVASFFTWVVVMLSLGYFFSYTALSISRDVRKFFGILLLFFIAFFILEKIIAFVIELFEIDNKDK